ncbi:MAG: CvpA family protein [Paludibacteraceae bacterium]|nr:CvpA family protein [Paludibacteraceae bacterium]MBP8781928.1 CvpA family protein [Paludibacteraceae bacterium]
MENYIDIVLIIPLIWGLIRGLFKGFIMTVGSVIGFILGFYVSNNYALSLSSYLQSWFSLSAQIAYVFAYLMIFLVVILSIFSISLLLEKTIKHISLGWLNKVIGAIVGCLKYALIVSLLLNLVEIIDEKVDIVAEETKQSSYMYKPLLQIVPAILPSITYYEDKKL